MMLAVMYAANIGGTGSIIGTGPNLVLKAQLDTLVSSLIIISFLSVFLKIIIFLLFRAVLHAKQSESNLSLTYIKF